MPKSIVVKLVHERQLCWWVGYEGEEVPYLLTGGTEKHDQQAMRRKVAELTRAQLRAA